MSNVLDTAAYWPRIATFRTPLLEALKCMNPVNFCMTLIYGKNLDSWVFYPVIGVARISCEEGHKTKRKQF